MNNANQSLCVFFELLPLCCGNFVLEFLDVFVELCQDLCVFELHQLCVVLAALCQPSAELALVLLIAVELLDHFRCPSELFGCNAEPVGHSVP